MTGFRPLLILPFLFNVLLAQLSGNQLSYLESSIGANSCEFYRKLESIVPCGEDGYVLNFAYKYCLAYLNERNDYIDKAWQDGVRVCLQRRMLSTLNYFSQCSMIRDRGFGSHTGCYLRPLPNSPQVSFCNLPWQDITNIVMTAKWAALDGAVWTQIYQMATHCKDQQMAGINQSMNSFLIQLMESMGVNFPDY